MAPVPWPTRSPDVTRLNCFLCGAMKGMAYETPAPSEMDLIARIHHPAIIVIRRLIYARGRDREVNAITLVKSDNGPTCHLPITRTALEKALCRVYRDETAEEGGGGGGKSSLERKFPGTPDIYGNWSRGFTPPDHAQQSTVITYCFPCAQLEYFATRCVLPCTRLSAKAPDLKDWWSMRKEFSGVKIPLPLIFPRQVSPGGNSLLSELQRQQIFFFFVSPHCQSPGGGVRRHAGSACTTPLTFPPRPGDAARDACLVAVGEKREIPEKTRRPTEHRPARFPRAKNPGVTLPGIEPVSPWWEANRSATAALLIHVEQGIDVGRREARFGGLVHDSGPKRSEGSSTSGRRAARSSLFVMSRDHNEPDTASDLKIQVGTVHISLSHEGLVVALCLNAHKDRGLILLPPPPPPSSFTTTYKGAAVAKASNAMSELSSDSTYDVTSVDRYAQVCTSGEFGHRLQNSRLPPGRTGFDSQRRLCQDFHTSESCRMMSLPLCISAIPHSHIISPSSALKTGKRRTLRAILLRPSATWMFFAFEFEKRGSDKGDTTTSFKRDIAARRKALNWHGVRVTLRVKTVHDEYIDKETQCGTVAKVAERLACSPFTKKIRVQSPAGSVGIFPDHAVGWRVFSGISRLARLFIPALRDEALSASKQTPPGRPSAPNIMAGNAANEVFVVETLRQKDVQRWQRSVRRHASSLQPTASWTSNDRSAPENSRWSTATSASFSHMQYTGRSHGGNRTRFAFVVSDRFISPYPFFMPAPFDAGHFDLPQSQDQHKDKYPPYCIPGFPSVRDNTQLIRTAELYMMSLLDNSVLCESPTCYNQRLITSWHVFKEDLDMSLGNLPPRGLYASPHSINSGCWRTVANKSPTKHIPDIFDGRHVR
ncbi:hypothetical protein PR048_032656 [Dryococelus australis]|uniref:Uncharacterized protein n=1 Tax=Dryococelus australis TaxID=614101 RepID=A0ABQ9G2U1_9NEOP|nr:hypothetical protein PR048_032656 [Dryococelus australis]